jgi:hypothetical protein
MPISFTSPEEDSPNEEPTEGNEDLPRDYELEEGASDSETEASVSEYEGALQEAPLKMFFGPKECRRIFEQPSDRSAFVRVCGNKEEGCKRGHSVLTRAREGYYDTSASRKYVDGMLHTFQSKGERQTELHKLKTTREVQLAESVKYLTALEPTATRARAKSKGEDQTNVEEGYASLPTGRESLKEPPVYGKDNSQEPPNNVPPGQPPTYEGSMGFMMSALTDTLKDLKEEMREIKGRVSDGAAMPQAQPTENLSPPPAWRDRPEEIGPADWWYTVNQGRNGASGVFPTWAEASHLVLGISGATVKKFRNYEEATEHVKRHQSPSPRDRSRGPNAPPTRNSGQIWFAVAKGKHGVCNLFQSWEEASEYFLGVPGAIVQKFGTRGEALTFLEDHQSTNSEAQMDSPSEDRVPQPRRPNNVLRSQRPVATPRQKEMDNYRPPMVLTGPDPSAKKNDEVFGVDLGSEMDLRAALLPPELPEGVSKGLANAMVDVVAIPGGFSGGIDESGSNEMALLGEAMEELVSQGRNQMEGASKADLHWRSGKRTSLRQVKSLDALRKRIKVLLKLRDKVIKHTIIAVRNACKRGGWQDLERIEAWAHGGYITRITRDAMDYYLSLHQHLMGLLIAGAPWDYVKMEQDHHVEELDLIRTTQDSRLQALCALYAYLRDGQSKNWHSDELQYKRNMDIFAREGGQGGDDLSTLGGSSGHCLKCGTSLHSGGKANCPWNGVSDAQAKKNANKVIRNMANPPAVVEG